VVVAYAVYVAGMGSLTRHQVIACYARKTSVQTLGQHHGERGDRKVEYDLIACYL